MDAEDIRLELEATSYSRRFFRYSDIISNRYHLGHYIEGDTDVEIGVHRGFFAKSFLRNWKGKTYHLVDPWLPYGQIDKDRTADFLHTKELFKDDKRVTIWRMTSEEAAKEVPDDLDFVYIDADHNYPKVMLDLQSWYPKVKQGGILAGHDTFASGVLNALLEFFDQVTHNITIIPALKNNQGIAVDAASWWIRKE